jgi:hypothetical protein
MVRGMSLRKTAAAPEIALSTSFLWRHKILTALQFVNLPALEGIVEMDETYILESDKGKRRIKGRKARKRGGKAELRGISKHQVSVLVAIDRSGNVVAKKTGKGRITYKQVQEAVSNHLGEVTCVCTDSATGFKKFSQARGVDHEVLNMNQGIRVKKGIYHVQHVNAYHSRLKLWLPRFKGVATKYLDNYMFWFRFLDLNRKLALQQMKIAMVHESFKMPAEVTSWHFRPCLW